MDDFNGSLIIWLHPVQEQRGQGGGHWNTSFVHMGNQRNAKKGCFFRLNVIRKNRN